MSTERPIEMNVTVKKEPFIKMEFGSGDVYHYDIFWGIKRFFADNWKKFPFARNVIIATSLMTVFVIVASMFPIEKSIHALTVMGTFLVSPVGKARAIPMVLTTIFAFFVAGSIFLWRCKCLWGTDFTWKDFSNLSSPARLTSDWLDGKTKKSWNWMEIDPEFGRCYKGDYFGSFYPPRDIMHKFVERSYRPEKSSRGLGSKYYVSNSDFGLGRRFYLRKKYIAMDMAVSVVCGAVLWMVWVHIIVLLQ